ncbi:hypothetical protein OG21DRAFT_1587749 [Imleria badia]|nr:hypothetical protein OG21DRAFT_1587749 [Imleria badia]
MLNERREGAATQLALSVECVAATPRVHQEVPDEGSVGGGSREDRQWATRRTGNGRRGGQAMGDEEDKRRGTMSVDDKSALSIECVPATPRADQEAPNEGLVGGGGDGREGEAMGDDDGEECGTMGVDDKEHRTLPSEWSISIYGKCH